jgi:hypothetical protein
MEFKAVKRTISYPNGTHRASASCAVQVQRPFRAVMTPLVILTIAYRDLGEVSTSSTGSEARRISENLIRFTHAGLCSKTR